MKHLSDTWVQISSIAWSHYEVPDAMEQHTTLKYNFVGHSMLLVWPSVSNNMFGKSSNENYKTNQCRAIIKKSVPCVTKYIIWVLCMGQSINFDYLRKGVLNQNNIMLQLFLWHCATKMFNQHMPAKFSCVWKRWRYAWDIAFPLKKKHCILGDSNFIRLITYIYLAKSTGI